MAVHMKITVFFEVTPCSLVNKNLIQWVPPERLNQSTKLRGFTCQKTVVFLVQFIKY
jgi:hypothetical protein